MIKEIKANLKPIARLTLFMSFPWIIVIILGWFVMPFKIGYLKEIVAFGLFTLIFTCLVFVIKNKRIRFLLLCSFSLILSILAFVKLSFYINYGVKISASSLFVIFETNGTEASDFLSNYFNFKVLGLAVLIILGLILNYFFFKTKSINNLKLSIRLKCLFIVLIIISSFCIFKRLRGESLFLTTIYTYKDYKIAKTYLKETLAKQETNFLSKVEAKDVQQTYVIIIGESTSRWHMQLYNYERETNPLLSKIKDELVIFDSVITPNVHTIVALDKMLTLSDFNMPNKKNNASIIQLANKAGFETFWISNQKPVGIHESIPTIIGSAAKHKEFISTDNSSYEIYDESLLPYFEKALNNSSKKKIIFLHLIGSHTRYNRRYPKAFNVFKDENSTAFRHPKSKKLINEYDNAVRYNDFVVREIIEKVKSKNENSYVVYFSDHGDEVYDTFDFLGHNEYHGSRPMYEVPFIAWFSDEYKETNKELFAIENMTKRPYILEDFIHSFSEISNINFDKFEAEKSIFNSNFKKKKRLVKKGEDYDKR